MGDPFLCQHCAMRFRDIVDLDRHLPCPESRKATLAQRLRLQRTAKQAADHASDSLDDLAMALTAPGNARNPWRLTRPLAEAIMYLAERKDPDKGVSEDIDDLIKAAYEFAGVECPVDTFMLTAGDANQRLMELLDDYEAEYGVISQEEIDAVEAEFDALADDD